MKRNLSDYIIAIAVIICSVVLLVAMATALGGWNQRKAGRMLQIDFPDITGIRVHSEVRYAGSPAGRVVTIRYLTREERTAPEGGNASNAVRITVELNATVPELPDDVRVHLSSDTLLSEKFIAFSAGTPSRPALQTTAVLQGHSAANMDQLMEKIGLLAESIGPLLATAEKTLAGIAPAVEKAGTAMDSFRKGMDDVLPRISKLADSIDVTAKSATAAVSRIEKLADGLEEPLNDDLVKLKSTLVQLDSTLKTAQTALKNTDTGIGNRMDELGVVLQNLKVASTHAKAMFETLGQQPHRLIWGGKVKPLTPEAEILKSGKPIPATKPKVKR